MKKILYIHGWLSSGKSNTSDMLKKTLTDCEILCPDIPFEPNDAILFLKELVSTYKPNIIIGTSLGGFYANQLKGCFKLLINPAFNLPLDIITLGKHSFHNERIDGIQTFDFNIEHIDTLKEMKVNQFNDMSWEDVESTYVIIGKEDTVVTNIKSTCNNIFGEHKVIEDNFGHRLEQFIIDEHIKPIVDNYEKLINPIINFQPLM